MQQEQSSNNYISYALIFFSSSSINEGYQRSDVEESTSDHANDKPYFFVVIV